MARPRPGRPSRRRRLLATCAAAVSATLVAALLTLTARPTAARATAASTPPSGDEAAAGLVALSASYPGGLPALLELFTTGECADLGSYDTAPPQCRSVLDQIAALGAGQPFPATLPAVAGDVDVTVPDQWPKDPDDEPTLTTPPS